MAYGYNTTYGTGANDYILFPGAFDSGTLTWSVWFYRHAGVNWAIWCDTRRINSTVSTAPGYGLRIDDNDAQLLAGFNSTPGWWSFSNIVTLSVWNHIAISYDSGSVDNNPVARVNGSNVSPDEYSTPVGTFVPGSNPWLLGNFATSSGNAPNGIMAEFAIWNRILSADETIGLSKGYSPLHYPGLLLYAPLVRDVVNYCNNSAPTVSGALVQNHPRIIYPRRTFFSIPTAAGSVSGAVDSTLEAMTISGAGELALEGSVTSTLEAMTVSGVGELALEGSVTSTLEAMTVSGVGELVLEGSVTSTLGAVTVSGAGELVLEGSVTSTLAEVTVSGAGAVAIEGDLATTLGAMIVSSLGITGTGGNVTSTLDAVTSNANGILALEGTLTSTLADVILSAAESVSTIQGVASVVFEAAKPIALMAAKQPKPTFTSKQPVPGFTVED